MADDVLLDTNIILRLLRADQPTHHAEARRLFEQAREGKLRLLVPSLVVAEVVFVLQGFYRLSRAEIAQLLTDLIATPNVQILETRTVVRATPRRCLRGSRVPCPSQAPAEPPFQEPGSTGTCGCG